MNKYLIVLMAICLLSVHAHVKRDAPATASTEQNYINNIAKQFEEVSKTLSEKIKETFNTDDMKKHINEFTANVNKALDDLKEKKA